MINIGTFAVPKTGKDGGSTKVIINGAGSKSRFEPHYIWGQYFDDTEDIYGDIKNAANIFATGIIHGDSVEATEITAVNMYSDNIDASIIHGTEKIYAPYIHGTEVNGGKLTVGNDEIGKWILEVNNDVDMTVHTGLNKTFRVMPHEKDVFNVNEERVKVNNKLDLSNVDEGTSVTMGKTNVEASNTNIKSVVQDGFYFTDNENNVAIGISNNYIQMGIDVGSSNFLSGSTGWRIQPDGTAEF